METADDAGVYQLTADMALLQTVDFFTPIVDDPYTFGQVAVANALSDVYAMGGHPLTAMNIVCFPVNTMDLSILREILAGGLDKMREANVVLVGGHSVEDPELKYGLSVTGVIHPDKVLTNTGAKAGDRLLLTKPLGTGIINTAVKGEMANQESVTRALECMTQLNKAASEAMGDFSVHACTDITGFGLLGHAAEMIEGTDIGMILDSGAIPLLPDVQELVETGMVPAGAYRNKEFRSGMVQTDPGVPEWQLDVFFDPQTSGGLLIALSPQEAETLLTRLREAGLKDTALVGEIVKEPSARIIVR